LGRHRRSESKDDGEREEFADESGWHGETRNIAWVEPKDE
jgi:hypothetical protein